MSVVTLHRPVDSPLSLDVVRQERIEIIAAMAADLLENNSYSDHGDSIMTLVGLGYPTFEIFALVADARQVATEHVVATEMSEPLAGTRSAPCRSSARTGGTMKYDLNANDRRYLRLLQMGSFERRRGGWRFGTNRIDQRVVERLVAAGRAVLIEDRIMLPRRDQP